MNCKILKDTLIDMDADRHTSVLRWKPLSQSDFSPQQKLLSLSIVKAKHQL